MTRAACVAAVLMLAVAGTAMSDEREELERALAQALAHDHHDVLTEENELPQSGAPTAAALVFLLKKECVRLEQTAGVNSWTVGSGCGTDCWIGRFTSPLMPGEGLICRVARQADIRVVSFTPPERDARGDVKSHVEYTATVVDVATWARDPEYLAIWKSYGLNFQTFHAFADLVKTTGGWIPYE